MAELDEHWKAGHSLAEQLIGEFKKSFPASRKLFVFGDTRFDIDEAFGWLFFQAWYVDYRAKTLAQQAGPTLTAGIVDSYLKGFADTLYVQITGGREQLSERDAALLKAFDQTRENLSLQMGRLVMPKDAPDPWDALAARLYGLAVLAVCSEAVAKRYLQAMHMGEMIPRYREFLDTVESLLAPLETRLKSEDPQQKLHTGDQGKTGLSRVPTLESGWPRLSDDELSGLSPEEKRGVRELEQKGIDGESLATQDIVVNCQSKLQFAKTYRVLRADKETTLNLVRSSTSSHRREVVQAVATAYERIIDYKFELLARHFTAKWGEPITRWTGWQGCSLLIGACLCLLCIVVEVIVTTAAWLLGAT